MIGETISHYRILSKLGGGGMGVIYEAEDIRLGRRVALKFIPDNLAGDRNALERFEREARAASQLAHPNICTIHDIEDNNGHPFLVMEKLEGESLKQKIHHQPLDIKQVLEIGVQVASALEASHAKGIIHRDVKPGNIFLTTNGPVKVLDFGLAKLPRNHALGTSEDTPTDDSLTAADVVPGTAIYMSPEQARSEQLDPRSDLFSFGVVLYEMATGRKPFHGKNTVTTLSAVLRDKPKSPAEVNPKIPAELKPALGRFITPSALWWFRWGAMSTLFFGVLLALLKNYFVQVITIDASEGFVNYAFINMGIGVWLAIIMWFNVWFIIWPNQQKALNIDGRYPDLAQPQKDAAAKTAGMFSRINTMLSIPMLFCMVATTHLYGGVL